MWTRLKLLQIYADDVYYAPEPNIADFTIRAMHELVATVSLLT